MQTHLDYNSFPGIEPARTSAKFIYVARNPKDVAVSYYYHTLGFEFFQYEGDWDDFYERFISGQVVDGSWFDHVMGWWNHKGMDVAPPFNDTPTPIYLILKNKPHTLI